MTTHVYDLRQLHDDLIEQIEQASQLLEATESLADGGEAHDLASNLVDALADTQAALSAYLDEGN